MANREDRELQGLEKMLIEMCTVTDVRDYLEEKLALKSVLDIEEVDFVEIDEDSKKVWSFIYFYFEYCSEGVLLKRIWMTLFLWKDNVVFELLFL